jgi:hypothetical protein
MSPKKSKKPKPSAEQQAAADQVWAELEAQFDREWPLHRESRLQVARILYEMKRWLKKWGKNKGRKGRWMEFLRTRNPPIPISTANDYVRYWQETQDIPPGDCVLARLPISQQNRENNLPESGKLAAATTPPGAVAKIKAADDKDADKSEDQRIGVECVFVLTMAEKIAFMEAVEALTPLRATQAIYKAVIAAANGAGE